MLYSGEAIFLKRRFFREDDFLVTLLSKEYGKINLVVKSGAKLKSKLACPLSGLFRVEFTAARGRELDKITFSSILERFDGFESNLENRLRATQIIEIIDRLISEKSADFEIYNKTLEALRALNNIKNESLGKFLVYKFLWSSIYRLGCGPEMNYCVNCRKNKDLYAFSFRCGGVLCAACKNMDNNSQTISPTLLTVLASTGKSNGRITLNDLTKFVNLVNLWAASHFSKPVQSLNFSM